MKMKCLLIALAAVLFGQYLQAWDGNGTEAAPYEIATKADLEQLATNVNAGTTYAGEYFILSDDLDLENAPWTPIGYNATYRFMGTFDGNGKVIDKLKINTDVANTGFFGYLESAVIKNLGITDADVVSTSGRYIGGICGYATKTTFDNCFVTGSISGADYSVAGISGNLDDASSVCSNCHFIGEITSSGNYNFGGLLGSTSATVTHCQASGSVSGKNKSGMLIGEAKGPVNNCFAIDGTVTGSSKMTGGLIGYSTHTITQCYTDNVTVTGTDNEIGGLIGEVNGGTVSECFSSNCIVKGKGYAGGLIGMIKGTGTLTDCYTFNTVTGTNQKIGGLVGDGSDGSANFTVFNCYAAGSVSTTGDNVGGIIGKLKADIPAGNLVAVNPSIEGGDYVSKIIGSYNLQPTAYAYENMAFTMTGTKSPVNGENKSAGELIQEATYLGLSWDFDAIWVMGNGCYPLPTLKKLPAEVQPSEFPEHLKFDVSIETSTDGNGTIVAPADLKAGDDLKVTVTPDNNYQVETFTVNGEDKTDELENGEYVVVCVKEDHYTLAATFMKSTSTTGNAVEKTSVYPTVTEGEIYIAGKDAGQAVSVFDLSGREILNTCESTVTISELANGVYLVKVAGTVTKVIKK